MEKCSHRIIGPLSDLPDGVFALRLLNEACSYRNAGEHLFEDGSNYDHPSYFCLAHGIELLLKSYLASEGVKRKELNTHCLECLFKSAQALGLRVPSIDDLAKRIFALNTYWKIFRYPDLVILAALDRREIIETFDEIFRFVQPAVIHARLAVPPGQYEVDEFTNGADLPGR